MDPKVEPTLLNFSESEEEEEISKSPGAFSSSLRNFGFNGLEFKGIKCRILENFRASVEKEVF